MGKDFEELLSGKHAEAGKSLKKVIASKGTLLGNLYFAGDGKKTAGVVITLTARDPKGQKALTGGKELRKRITGAKFARGTVLMDGGKLVIELLGGNATAAMLKKAFKEDTFRQDPVLKLLSRATIKKKGATDQDDEVEEGAGLSQADLDLTADAFESGGFWRKSELKALQKAQGSLEQANAELSECFLSVESVQAELAEQSEVVAEVMDVIASLTAELNAAVDSGERAVAMGLEVLIERQHHKLAEAQARGSDPFLGGTIDPAVTALLSRVQRVPLERKELKKAHKRTQKSTRSGLMTHLFSGLTSSKSASKSIRDRAEDAIREAKAREHGERVRLALDSALEPLIVENRRLDALIASNQTAEAHAVGVQLLAQAQALIARAEQEREQLKASQSGDFR